jgi:RNA polymerase sigma factor (TIGR02999 family)
MHDDIRQLLRAWKAGSAEAGDAIISRTYDELRRLAHYYRRRERPEHTLQTTALLHEAYLRLLRSGPGAADDRDAFFRLMAAEMRHRLVDHARRRRADKRGGGAVHESLDEAEVASPPSGDDMTRVLDRMDAALVQLTEAFPRAARVVQLRFLAGLTNDEAARELKLSPGTVKRDWTFARAWLASAIDSPFDPE